MPLVRSPEEFALFVNNQRKKERFTQEKISRTVKLKQATISAFENKPGSTKLDTLFRILSVLDLEINLVSKKQLLSRKEPWKEEW